MKKSKIELSDISKEVPFRVPEGYFDNFYTNLKLKLDEESDEFVEPVKNEKFIYLDFNFKRFLMVAATIFLFIFMLFQPSDIKIDENSLIVITDYKDLSEDDIISYLSLTSSDYELYVELNK